MKNNWEVKKIGELCNLSTGGTPSRNKPEYFEGGEIRWLVSGDIHKKEIYDCEGRITEEGLNSSNARFLPINSVLIALNGQGKTRGTVALLKTKATCNQSLVSIYPKDTQKILPEYIFCNLHGRYEEIRKITGDDDKDRRGLNMPLIRDIDIPFPPLPEQQRIVAILDEAFAAIGRAKENAEKNLQNARELFDSYLQSVFANPSDSWEVKRINEITKVVNGFAFSSKDFSSTNEIKSVKITNVGVKEFVEDTGNLLPEKYGKTYKDYQVQPGNIVIALTRTIISAGLKVAVVSESYEGALLNQRVAALVPNENLVNQRFLYNYLCTDKVAKFVRSNVNTLMQPNLSINDLKNMSVPLPNSVIEQEAIVSKIDALSAETKKLENIYRQKINDLDELKKSILQKAFSGELTAKRQVSNVIEFPVRIPNISATDLQAGIVALAFRRHQESGKVLTFGHVKAEKIVHLAQSVLNIELDREPVKDAAGPNDFPQLKKVESRAEKAGFFKTVKQGYGYTYIQGNQFDNLIEKTKTALNDKAAELTDLIDLLVPMDTQQAELVATVYAAWNNLLLDNQTINDEAIVSEARENWHEAKLNIPRERFFKTISWMKENNLIPNGKGKKVSARLAKA